MHLHIYLAEIVSETTVAIPSTGVSTLEAIALPLLLLAGQLLAVASVLPIRIENHSKFLSVFGLMYFVSSLFMIEFYSNYREISWEDVGLTASPTLATLGYGMAGGLSCIAIFTAGHFIAGACKIDLRELQARMKNLVGSTPQQMLVFLTLAVVVGGLLEEIVFRGLTQRLLDSNFGGTQSPILALLIASSLFASMHIPMMGAYGFALTFVAGMILGWIFQATVSLYPCMFAHGLTNFVMVLFIYYNVLDSGDVAQTPTDPGPDRTTEDNKSIT